MSSAHDELGASLGDLLQTFDRVAVAVSGGIDSLTLATVAGRRHRSCEMFHAVSAAVPPEATARVKDFSEREGWRLHLVDAREFERREYISNPVNRCFFCKQSLYETIRAVASNTSAQIVSGTNADDLGEYRPGLDAAREYGVRHPFVELGVTKSDIRSLARWLRLDEIAELPSSPCLSSRVETGVAINPDMLRQVHAAETAVRARITARSVRCRVRGAGIVIEVDDQSLARMTPEESQCVIDSVSEVFASKGGKAIVSLAPYRIGSAFLVNQIAPPRH